MSLLQLRQIAVYPKVRSTIRQKHNTLYLNVFHKENTEILTNFLAWKVCRDTEFPNSFIFTLINIFRNY